MSPYFLDKNYPSEYLVNDTTYSERQTDRRRERSGNLAWRSSMQRLSNFFLSGQSLIHAEKRKNGGKFSRENYSQIPLSRVQIILNETK